MLCNRLGVNLFCNKGIILKCTNFVIKYFNLKYPFLQLIASFCVIFCTKLTKNKAWVCGRYLLCYLLLSAAKRHGLEGVILDKKTLYQSSWDALEVKLVKTIMVVRNFTWGTPPQTPPGDPWSLPFIPGDPSYLGSPLFSCNIFDPSVDLCEPQVNLKNPFMKLWKPGNLFLIQPP